MCVSLSGKLVNFVHTCKKVNIPAHFFLFCTFCDTSGKLVPNFKQQHKYVSFHSKLLAKKPNATGFDQIWSCFMYTGLTLGSWSSFQLLNTFLRASCAKKWSLNYNERRSQNYWIIQCSFFAELERREPWKCQNSFSLQIWKCQYMIVSEFLKVWKCQNFQKSESVRSWKHQNFQ